ncbi:MAG TPA: Mut7-C RNAse domain-containing protein [Candidatus Heimdallarchaeota archaeon]|nr:Mut7-C RNAse domain-containing protein [Candidatus Heimdallarchaeota archaeon]
MNRATFRFYAELNDFLSQDRRKRTFDYEFSGSPGIKDAIEALGVPHVEVDVILANGVSVDFSCRLQDGDRIAVYPVFESLDITPLTKLRPEPMRKTAFIADVHLRKLARYLRLLGFDTLHENDYADEEIVQIAARTGRIILTRDRMLLKNGAVTRGYWVRSTNPIEQAREVIRRFDLRGQVKLFGHCPVCNDVIVPVGKEEVYERIPPKTALWLDEYFICTRCGKLYWRGTHYRKIVEKIDGILAGVD